MKLRIPRARREPHREDNREDVQLDALDSFRRSKAAHQRKPRNLSNLLEASHAHVNPCWRRPGTNQFKNLRSKLRSMMGVTRPSERPCSTWTYCIVLYYPDRILTDYSAILRQSAFQDNMCPEAPLLQTSRQEGRHQNIRDRNHRRPGQVLRFGDLVLGALLMP